MSCENVCKLKTAGKMSSKLINYFCNVDVNVSACESESKLARPTPRAKDGGGGGGGLEPAESYASYTPVPS